MYLTDGGPIGPRATCAIARVCLNIFDQRLARTWDLSNIEVELYKRYVDDLRKYLRAIIKGIFWDPKLKRVMWSRKKEQSDTRENKSGLEVTAEVLGDMMNSMVVGVRFTTEILMESGFRH